MYSSRQQGNFYLLSLFQLTTFLGSPCWENYDLVGAGYCCNTDINNGVCPAYDPSETAYCPFGYEFTTTTTTDSGSGDASSGEQCIATGRKKSDANC